MSKSNNSFAKIWQWYPQELNRFSSIWWFFLLFPRQNGAYGPKQMMFSLVSRVGDAVRINKVPHPGVKWTRTAETMEDPFPGIVLGWLYDGEHMHDGLVQHPAIIKVDEGQAIKGWDDNGYGGEMVANGKRPFGTKAHFRGERGEARFEVWGDPVSDISSPALFERETFLGGANVLAWKHFQFEGEFSSPAGTEMLDGVGYFQRICLNIMPFPWKWILARFGDESVFSCFIPYLGPHLLRRKDWFFPEWLENITMSIQPNAYFSRGGSWKTTLFSKMEAKTVLGDGPYPDFLVSVRAENGDFLRFRANSYIHTQVLLERRLSGPVWSTYNYNEYPFAISDLSGSIDGEQIDSSILGPGFGNTEYTWGLGL